MSEENFLDDLADYLGKNEKGEKSWFKLECLDLEDDDD